MWREISEFYDGIPGRRHKPRTKRTTKRGVTPAPHDNPSSRPDSTSVRTASQANGVSNRAIANSHNRIMSALTRQAPVFMARGYRLRHCCCCSHEEKHCCFTTHHGSGRNGRRRRRRRSLAIVLVLEGEDTKRCGCMFSRNNSFSPWDRPASIIGHTFSCALAALC